MNTILEDPNNPGNIESGQGRQKAVVLCGDMNDEPAAATTQILQGPDGSEINSARGFAKPDKGDAFRMWNLAPLLEDVNGQPPFTRKFKGRGEVIDHIFASHRLVNPNRVPTQVRTTFAGEHLPSITEDPNARRNDPGSDHAAVSSVFDV